MIYWDNDDDNSGILFRVQEVRFTQGTVRLRAVNINLHSSSYQFSSRYTSPEPADPVSHRSKAKWKDSEIKLCASKANDYVTLSISNRIRRVRTVIGKVTFNLTSLEPPLNSKEPFVRTLPIQTDLYPSLNMKIEIYVEMNVPNADSWKRFLTRSDARRMEDTWSIASASHSELSINNSIGMPVSDSEDGKSKTKFGFNLNPDTLGVVFLEVVSVTNLPKFRSLSGLTFDMDPFIIISFGRKVYKTPHKRHTLNPTFNSKIAFDVGKSETTFSILFSVWDQDKITLNDLVAETKLPIQRVISSLSPVMDPETKLYDLSKYYPVTLMLPLKHKAGESEMLIKIHYYPLAAIRQQMWRGVISLYDTSSSDLAVSLSYSELKALLNSLGSTLTESMLQNLYTKEGLDYKTDRLPEDKVIIGLENIAAAAGEDRIILFRICPLCHKKTPNDKRTTPLAHLSLCASRHWTESSSVLLDHKYVSSAQASKRWYSKFLSKFSFGSYKLGANSANILVQDRITGQIFEERMSTAVRFGMRVLYRMGPVERKKFQKLSEWYTKKRGVVYSSPESASSIRPFIKFHKLDMSEVEKPVNEFKTFNDFFYRKLKPGSRPCENAMEPRTVVSTTDCRLIVYETVTRATQLWIKGKNFSIKRLLGDTYPELVDLYADEGSIVVFRLAPQDYHRVHSPVEGVMGKPKHIEGQYYTVNPMAVRSSLDVFGENARTVFPIDSPQFGRVTIVMVGAMMVGSCVVTQQPGAYVKRTDELGYFQFGGSTVIALFERGKFVPDGDIAANSMCKMETLVKVGMSIGHDGSIPEYVRSYDTRISTIRRAKSTITGGGSYLPFSLD